MVSGSFHSPARGPFHLSLTVLVHYRSSKSIQPWRMVPPYSDRISPVPPYLILDDRLRVRDSNPLRSGFPTCSTGPHRLGCSPFARHYSGNNYCYLFLQVLRCFSSLGFLSCDFMVFNHKGFPIQTSTDQRLFAPPRSFSQLITSFVVSESLGIPHTLLFASYS